MTLGQIRSQIEALQRKYAKELAIGPPLAARPRRSVTSGNAP